MTARAFAMVAGLCLIGCSAPPPPAPAPAPAAPTAQPARALPAPAPGAAVGPPLRLANGLAVLLLPPPPGLAELQLGLLAGRQAAAAGIADLAAATLAENGDPGASRSGLALTLARLGGALQIDVGARHTWITVRVPADRWIEAQRALAAALQGPAQSRSQIERIRDRCVQRRVEELASDPALAAARAFAAGETSTAAHVGALLDRDASEVTLFQTRCYRPDNAVLALRVPGSAADIGKALDAGLGKWTATAAGRAAGAVRPAGLQPGLYWAPAEPAAFCRATVVMALPGPLAEDAADLATVHACLTLDGVGGRLERLQHERTLAQWRWRSTILADLDAPALVLTVETTPEAAIALWQTIDAARRSLRDLPPNASELAIARTRAALTVQLAAGGAHLPAALTLHDLPPATAARRLAALAGPGPADVARAVDAWWQLPVAMIVHGGRPPADFTGFSTFVTLPPGVAAAAAADRQAQTTAATPWLDEALEVAGGRDLLRRLAGYDAEATRRTEQAPAATETLRWRADGDLVRRRKILGAEIVTELAGSSYTERMGDRPLTLTSRAAAQVRGEAARHPLALLAAYARGELPFRAIARRTVGDRDLMVLEGTGGPFDRLRLHVDTESHLVRVVEVWETAADGTIVHLQEAWSDYRQIAGLRAPFRRLTEMDDGQNRVETVLTAWTPALRGP